MKEFMNTLLRKDTKPYIRDNKRIIKGKGICVSLIDIRIIFQVILNDFLYFSSKYPLVGKIVNT